MYGELDYSGLGAPGLDSLAQMTSPAYIETPPNRFRLEYGAPSNLDMAYDQGANFQFLPPHKIRMSYGDTSAWRMEVGKSYNVKGTLYSLNADASINVVPVEGNIFTLQPNDPSYSTAMAEVKAAYAPSSEKSGGAKAAGFLTGLLEYFGIGRKTPAATTTSTKTQQEEGFWAKHGSTVMVAAAGLAGVGLIAYLATRDSGASDQSDRLTRTNRGARKGKKSKSKAKRSAPRKHARKGGRR